MLIREKVYEEMLFGVEAKTIDNTYSQYLKRCEKEVRTYFEEKR